MRRLFRPATRLGLWLLLAAVVLVVAAGVGLREDDDLAAQLRRPAYLVEIALLYAGAAVAGAAALLAAVPGRRGRRRAGGLGLVLGLVAASILAFEPATASVSPVTFVMNGLRCTFSVAAFALLPWAVLFATIGRAAPLDGRSAGAYAGVAACLVGSAAVRIACPLGDALHLLTWHVLPIVSWSALSAAVGGTYLMRWRAPGHVRG